MFAGLVRSWSLFLGARGPTAAGRLTASERFIEGTVWLLLVGPINDVLLRVPLERPKLIYPQDFEIILLLAFPLLHLACKWREYIAPLKSGSVQWCGMAGWRGPSPHPLRKLIFVHTRRTEKTSDARDDVMRIIKMKLHRRRRPGIRRIGGGVTKMMTLGWRRLCWSEIIFIHGRRTIIILVKNSLRRWERNRELFSEWRSSAWPVAAELKKESQCCQWQVIVAWRERVCTRREVHSGFTERETYCLVDYSRGSSILRNTSWTRGWLFQSDNAKMLLRCCLPPANQRRAGRQAFDESWTKDEETPFKELKNWLVPPDGSPAAAAAIPGTVW